jgi:Antitoxin ParD
MSMQSQYSDDDNKLPGKRSRLMIDISPELLQRIKIAAAQKNFSIREYIEDILNQAVPSEKRERGRLNRAAIEDLLKTREEILHERQGKPFSDSTELIRQMREERSEYLGEL